MKYFKEGKTQCGYGAKGIVLETIFSISKNKNEFDFFEECDGYFCKEYTKKQAIEVLEEAISWIKLQDLTKKPVL